MACNDAKSKATLTSSRVEAVVASILLFFAVTVIRYCVWTLDRGFEITDEAYYLLLAIHADSQNLYVSAQHWITGWLWRLSGTLALFRAFGLGALLLSSVLLALGVYSTCIRAGVLTKSVQEKTVVISATVISALLYASTINFSPCYNLLASAGAYAAAGFVLFAAQRVSIIQKYAICVCSGVALAVEVICKASAGIATFSILVFWLVRFDRSRSHKVLSIIVIAGAALTAISAALGANTTILGASDALSQGLQLFRIVQTEPIHERLYRYFAQFAQLLSSTAAAFAIPLVSVVLHVKTKRAGFAYLALPPLVATIYLKNYWRGGWNNAISFTPPFAVVSMLCMALGLAAPALRGKRYALELACGLILLPYSVAMGTGNTLFSQCVVSLASWGALIGVLICARFELRVSKVCTSVLGFCFVVTVVLQIVTSGLRPYHLPSSLLAQNQGVAIGNLGVVKVDADTLAFLSDIKAAADNCDIQPGAPFLGLYNDPGVALALEAAPISSPWLNNKAQAEFVLRRTKPQALHSFVLALNTGSAGVRPELPRQLRRFPASYRYCGVATYPFRRQRIEIWKYPGP